MNTLIAHLRHALRIRQAERSTLALMLLLPLLFGALMTVVMGGDARPTGTVVLVDHDDSLASQFLGSVFTQGEFDSMFRLERESDEKTARARAEAGEVSAVVIIPEGFGQALLRNTPSELELITNPAQRILPGIIEETLSIVLEAVHYARSIFGPEIDAIIERAEEGGEPGDAIDDAFVAAIAVDVSQRIESLESLVFPPVLDVEVIDHASEGEQRASVAELFFPAILMMSLLFAAQHLAGDIWREREAGTLRRLAISPSAVSQWLLARALTSLVVFGAAALVVSTLAFAWHGWPWWRLTGVLGWALLSALPLFALMLLLSCLAPSRRGADVLTTMVLFPLMIIGGSFFPIDTMPDWLAGIGRWLPNGMAVDRLTGWLVGDLLLADMLATAVALLLMAIVLLALCLLRLPVMARRAG